MACSVVVRERVVFSIFGVLFCDPFQVSADMKVTKQSDAPWIGTRNEVNGGDK